MSKITTLKSRIKTLDNDRVSTIAADRIRGRRLAHIRERVLLRDSYTCRRCGRVSVDLEVDHIVPLFLGGAESDENRQLLCPIPCHQDKTALEEKMRGNKY